MHPYDEYNELHDIKAVENIIKLLTIYNNFDVFIHAQIKLNYMLWPLLIGRNSKVVIDQNLNFDDLKKYNVLITGFHYEVCINGFLTNNWAKEDSEFTDWIVVSDAVSWIENSPKILFKNKEATISQLPSIVRKN